ncbi:sensor histidine kinase [Nitrincola sp. MINF-07-Sa-05]|uniref:sensor histidine kinase n=1 Tax=Nitrincola salilacus TaxID=3400273 RepID=UPI0039184B7A
MLLGVNIFSADPARKDLAFRRVIALFLLPLGVYIGITVWQYRVTPNIQLADNLATWLEPLGEVDFTEDYLQQLTVRPTDFAAAHWTKSISPPVAAAQVSSDTSKYRLWLRISIPENLVVQSQHEGRLSVLVNRVVGSGPWSAWSEEAHLQAARRDWGMQWNKPMRLMLPLGTREVYLSLPVIPSEGYAFGTISIGMADDINLAWEARNMWMADLPRSTSIVAILMALMTLPMALRHRHEKVYVLFSANSLVWCLTSLQYFHDHAGNPGLNTWLGLAMDLSINWNVALTLLLAFEFQRDRGSTLSSWLLLYACISTLLAILMMLIGKYSFFINHHANIIVFLFGLGLYFKAWLKSPDRDGFVVLLAMLSLIGTGIHSLLYVSSLTHPDHVHTFPFAVLGSCFAFLYAISRRSALAVEVADQYQTELQSQLSEQKTLLETQHQQIAELEVQRQLSAQREAMLQDLHDGLGSNLTSALFQARKGELTQHDTVLLLQELANELRELSSVSPALLSINDILAELRQRIQKRLTQGGIALEWRVATKLPGLDQFPEGTGQHLRAMLSEAIANVLKHANASRIVVFAECIENALCIEVTDNGCGYVQDVRKGGRGLAGARHRAKQLGCEFGIECLPKGGSRFWIRVPRVKLR